MSCMTPKVLSRRVVGLTNPLPDFGRDIMHPFDFLARHAKMNGVVGLEEYRLFGGLFESPELPSQRKNHPIADWPTERRHLGT